MQYYCTIIRQICVPVWPPSAGSPRQNLHAQCACEQRCQNESKQAKVKTNFPRVLKQKITRNFFNLKKTWRSRVVPDAIPSESKLKPYEGDRDMPYNCFSEPHM